MTLVEAKYLFNCVSGVEMDSEDTKTQTTNWLCVIYVVEASVSI